MKLSALLLLVAMALGAVACSRPARLNHLPVERFTAESSGYKHEVGELTSDGFIPSNVQHLAYGPTSPSQHDVSIVSGRTVVRLTTWTVAERYVPFKRSRDTVTLKEVPYVFVDP